MTTGKETSELDEFRVFSSESTLSGKQNVFMQNKYTHEMLMATKIQISFQSCCSIITRETIRIYFILLMLISPLALNSHCILQSFFLHCNRCQIRVEVCTLMISIFDCFF